MRVLEETGALFMIVAIAFWWGWGKTHIWDPCGQNEFGRHICPQLPVMLGYNTLVW